MNLATVDNLAVNHRCWLQHCSPLAKLLLVAAILALLLTTLSLQFVLLTACLVAAVAISNRLPLAQLAALSAVPMLLASLYAYSLGDWQLGWLIVGRAGTAAATVVAVAMTTPPLKLLTLLAWPLPGVLGEVMYFAYRSLFLLTGGVSASLAAVRLRRGREKLSFSRLRVMGQVIGMSVIRAWDLAGRQYDLLRLRGLAEGLAVQRDWRLRPADAVLVGLAFMLIAGWYYV